MAKASNQKLKLLYLMQIFMRETDDEHMLTMQEIINLLANTGIRGGTGKLSTWILRNCGISDWIS